MILLKLSGKVLILFINMLFLIPFSKLLYTVYIFLHGPVSVTKHDHLLGLGRKEGNVLFNDALNFFYLRLYGVGHMVKDHSNSEKGNPLPPHGLLFPINSKGYFICTIPHTGITYHGLCYTSRGALAETRDRSMGPPHEGSIRRPIAPLANALTTELHLAPPILNEKRPDNKIVCFTFKFTASMLFNTAFRS